MNGEGDPRRTSPRERTPWWFQLMLGVIGLSASVLYLSQAAFGDGGTRSFVIGMVWAVFALLWVLSALAARSRSSS